MKFLLLALSAAVFTTGCSQPKNRLTDDKNIEFQKKLAKANRAAEKQTLIVDVPTPNGTQQIPIETNLGTTTTDNSKNLDQEAEVLTIPERSEMVVEEKTEETAIVKEEPTSEKLNAEESRKKAQEEISKALPTKPEEQKQPEASTNNDIYELSFAEANAVMDQISTLISDKQEVINTVNAINTQESGLSFEKIGFRIDGTEDGLIVGITHDDKELALFNKVELQLGKPTLVTSNDIQLISVCANSECDVMLFAFRKVKDNKILFNLPLFVKIVDQQLVRAKLKTDEEYMKETQTAAQQPSSQPISLAELNLIREQITRTRLVGTDEELARITAVYVSPELKMDQSKLGIAIGTGEGKLHFQIGHDSQLLTEMANVELKFGTAFKAETAEKYVFSGICSNENCDIIFIAFTKIENKKMVFNMPILLRKSKDQVALVKLKSSAEYEAEAREILKSENKK